MTMLTDLNYIGLLALAISCYGVGVSLVLARRWLPYYLDSRRTAEYGQLLVAPPPPAGWSLRLAYLSRAIRILLSVGAVACILAAGIVSWTDARLACVLLLFGGFLLISVGIEELTEVRIPLVELRERGIVTRWGVGFGWNRVRWSLEPSNQLNLHTPAGLIRTAVVDRDRVATILANRCAA